MPMHIAGGKVENKPMLNPENFIDRHHAGKPARYGHGDDHMRLTGGPAYSAAVGVACCLMA